MQSRPAEHSAAVAHWSTHTADTQSRSLVQSLLSVHVSTEETTQKPESQTSPVEQSALVEQLEGATQ